MDSVNEGQDPDRKIAGPSSRKRRLMAAVVVALLAAMAFPLYWRYEELTHIQRLSTSVLLAAVFSQFMSQMLWNGSMLLPLQTFMKGLGFWELFMVRTGGLLAGYVVPVAGNLAVRMTYLKRRGLTHSEFAWATLLSNVLALFSGGVLAVFAVGILWMMTRIPPASIIGLAASVLALGIAGLVVLRFLPRFVRETRFQRWLPGSDMRGFQTSRRTMAWALALLLMRHSFNFLTFGLLFQSLSRAPIDFVTGGLVYAITSPARMIIITPGNLGINEWVVAIVGRVLSFDLTTGLIVALVFRGVSLVAQVLGVLLGGAWLALWGGP
jgi:lysylphosphatidylglycerol synthase-like protein